MYSEPKLEVSFSVLGWKVCGCLV